MILLKGSTTKYLSDLYSGDDDQDDENDKSESQIQCSAPVEPSTGT